MAGKKGDAAREAVKNKIIEAFGEDFVAFQDKKIYIQAKDGDGGEVYQFAITMTMPKVPIQAGASAIATSDENGVSTSAVSKPAATPTALSPEDSAKVHELMVKLGI